MLQTEIALHKKKLLATTVQAPGLTLEAMTLQRESTIWPEPMLLEDPLHAFEPTRHCGVILRIVKLMGGTICKTAGMHFGAILVMCPGGAWQLYHLLCREGIRGTSLVTRCIVKHKQPFCCSVGP